MKKYFLPFLLFITVKLTCTAQINLPSSSPLASVSQQIGLDQVSFTYSRPKVKGRKIFGNLVPFGKVWRTGANQCSILKIKSDIEINGRNIKAGSYGFFTIPGERTWKIILNSDDKQWGAFELDTTKNVLTFEVPAKKLSKNVEQMTVYFNTINPTSAEMILAWEKYEIKIFFEQCVSDQILAEIITKTADPNAKSINFEQAAEYYNDNNINLHQALAWAKKVLLTEQHYWNYELVASLEAKLNDCDSAIVHAQKSLELATKEKDYAYVLLSKNIIKKCEKDLKLR